MDELFSCFIKEVRFIRNLTPKTISVYQQSWQVYLRYSAEINQAQLNQFVIEMREAGLSIEVNSGPSADWFATQSPCSLKSSRRFWFASGPR
jgi:hypothetical protein